LNAAKNLPARLPIFDKTSRKLVTNQQAKQAGNTGSAYRQGYSQLPGSLDFEKPAGLAAAAKNLPARLPIFSTLCYNQLYIFG
jgi:hypothetical protein